MTRTTRRTVAIATAALAAAIACAAGTPAAPGGARTFAYSPGDALAQQHLPSTFWCAERGALLDRHLRCAAAGASEGRR